MRTLKKNNNKKDALVSKKISIIFLSLCILIYKIGLEKNRVLKLEISYMK